ncbi:MAG: hypothetical protein BWY69_01668 [Planctomycetes bacterium ADurb.Bin401]|nr:MAG: hypothetical protein BWY69_01668 [Planctomycetes bacterium ADurb.Bin401]
MTDETRSMKPIESMTRWVFFIENLMKIIA